MGEKKIIEVSIDSILPNPYQPRLHFSDSALKELADSIKVHGIIQPITVRKKDDHYEIVAGERRFRASKLAGLEKVPVIITDMDDEASAVVAMLENLQREDLDYLEEAIGYSNLIKEYGFTQQQLAEKLGKSQSTIANKIRLLKLDDEEIIIKAIDKISKNQMTVKKAEAMIKDILDNPKEEPKSEEEPPKRNMKAMINMRIYLNTIKQAYDMIKNTGVDAQYKEVEKDDYVDVIVRIPKRK